jgi:hypothetical protein
MIGMILLKIIGIIAFWCITAYLNIGLVMCAASSAPTGTIPKEFIIPLICIGLWFFFCYIGFPILIFCL